MGCVACTTGVVDSISKFVFHRFVVQENGKNRHFSSFHCLLYLVYTKFVR